MGRVRSPLHLNNLSIYPALFSGGFFIVCQAVTGLLSADDLSNCVFAIQDLVIIRITKTDYKPFSMKSIACKIAALLSLFLLFSCKGPSLFNEFSVHPKTISVDAEGGEYIITSDPFDCVYILVNNKSYETKRFNTETGRKTYSVSGGWLAVSFQSSDEERPTTVQVEVEENKTGESREATIVVSNLIDGDGRVKVTQSK